MANPKNENKEVLSLKKNKAETGINTLKKVSNEILKNDRNHEYTTVLAQVDVQNAGPKDIEALTFMQHELLRVLTKIAKKNPQAKLEYISPENLGGITKRSGIRLTTSEVIALSKLSEINLNPQSKTAQELGLIWKGMISEAKDAQLGFGQKFIKRFKEKPGETIVYTMAGATGIYLGLKLIGWLMRKGKETAAKKVTGMFSTGKILTALGLGALGAYMGKDSIANWLSEKFGMGKAVKKVNDLLEKIKKAKNPKEAEKWKAKLKTLVDKTKGLPGKLKNKASKTLTFAKRVKEERLWALAGREVPQEEKEKYIRFAELMKKTNSKLKINPAFLAILNLKKDYGEFLKSSPGLIEKVSEWSKLFTNSDKRNLDNLKKLVLENGNGEKLVFFLKEMVKKNGQLEEFKGKSVAEVMGVILSNPEKYIDKEAVKEANEKAKNSHEFWKRIQKMGTNPTLAGNTDYVSETLKFGTLAGISIVLDKSKKFGLWLIDGSKTSIFFESKIAYKTVEKLANWMQKDKESPLWYGGAYLQIGAYTAAIGAPLGSIAGIRQAMRGYGIFSPLKMGIGAVKGGISGTVKGAMWPIKAAGKGIIYMGKGGIMKLLGQEFTPIGDLKLAINQKKFILEDLKLGWIGNKFGWTSYGEKMANGQIEISRSAMEKLTAYENMYAKKKTEFEKIGISKSSKRYKNLAHQYEEINDKFVRKITQFWDGKKNCFRSDLWNQKMKELQNSLRLDEDLATSLKIASNENKLSRIGVLLLNPENPITRLMAHSPGKGNKLLRAMSESPALMETFTAHPGLAHDHKVIQMLKKGASGKELPVFEKAVAKRLSDWESLSRKELLFLKENPDMTKAFTKLSDNIRIMGKTGVNEFTQLKKILLDTKNPKASIIGKHLDEFKVIFKGSDTGRAAIRQILALDNKVFERLTAGNGLTEFLAYFRDFKPGNEAELAGILKKVESGLPENKQLLNSLKTINAKLNKAGILENSEILLENAKNDAAKAAEELSKAQKALADAKTPEAITKAEKAIEKAKKVQSAHQNTAEKLESLTKAKQAAEGAEKTSEAAKTLAKTEQEAAEAVSKSLKTAGEAGQVSRVARALKFLGIGGSLFGAGMSFYQSGKSTTEVFTTDVEGRSAIESANAALWAANGLVDTATLATLLGAKSVLLKTAGRAWAPLIPITYAGTKIYDSVKEGNLKSSEWVQKYNYQDLIHQWFSTQKSVSLGDSLRVGFKALALEKVNAAQGIGIGKGMDIEIAKGLSEKKESAHKIFKVLVAATENPLILQTAYSKGDEKTKKIDSLIGSSYTKYHEYYFRQEGAGMINDYASALKFINSAVAFNRIMHTRELLKKRQAKTFQIGKINLMESRYDFSEGTEPKPSKDFMPADIVKNYNAQMLEEISKINPQKKTNLDKMETGYLGMLYIQIIRTKQEAMGGKIKLGADSIKILNANQNLLKGYLESDRNVSLSSLLQNPSHLKVKMSAEELVKHLKGLSEAKNPTYTSFERNNYETIPGVFAILKLAQSFGYTGGRNENELKQFFSENKASFQGVFWDGSNWCIGKARPEFGEVFESKLTYSTIQKMITALLFHAQEKVNILDHRQDSMFANAYNFESQMRKMAETLQTGYNEGIAKMKPGEKMMGIVAPQGLAKNESNETAQSQKGMKAEIENIKKSTGWSQLNYKVINENSVEIKRGDSKEKTLIKKSGANWQIEGQAQEMNFRQAVILSNVLNYAKKIVNEGNWSGGKSRPFEVDGNSIDFDKSGTPFDTRFIDGDRERNWLSFMNNMGISHGQLTETLNNWYQAEVHFSR